MAKKTNNQSGCCVLTLPLLTEPWQEHIIETRFRIMEHLKNSLIRMELNKLKNLRRRKDFRQLEEQIKETPKGKERNALYKRRQEILKETGFSEFAFINDMTPMQKHFAEHFAAQIAHRAASDVWSAFNTFLFSNGREVHFTKRGTLESIANKKVGNGMNYRNGFFEWNGGKTPNAILLKIRVADPDTEYERQMLEKRMRYLRIVRRWMKTRWKYYLQITLEGPPAQKERPIGQGRVGIDIGPRTAAIVSRENVELIELADRIDGNHARKMVLQRKMDASKRRTNPEQFNENGTVRRYPKGQRPRWNWSKHYRTLQGKVRELERKNAAIRKYQHTCLANHILSLGTEIYVENMNFKGLQGRAKETVQDEKGRLKKKKRFGKSLAQKAPSMLLTILQNKLTALDPPGAYVEVETQSFRASQYDHTDGSYHKKTLRDRWSLLSNGDRIQRDIYSAFLLMNSRNDLKATDQGLCEQTYSQFKLLHDQAIENLEKSHIHHPSSFGIASAKPKQA